MTAPLPPPAWLVFGSSGTVVGADTDEQRAKRVARTIRGVLVGPLPVAADFRPAGERE